MKKFLLACALALGLLASPALASGTDVMCEYGSYEEWAATTTVEQVLITGPSLEAFAFIITDRMGVVKPVEITAIAVSLPTPKSNGYMPLQAFTVDGCSYGPPGGIPVSVGEAGLAAASVIDDKVEFVPAAREDPGV